MQVVCKVLQFGTTGDLRHSSTQTRHLFVITRKCFEILLESLINDHMLLACNSCSVMYLTREW